MLIDAIDMYGNSHSQGTCVLLEIPSTHKLVQYFQSLHTCRNEDIMSLKVYILPILKFIFVQAVLNIVVYQMLIVYADVLVNSAVLFKQ